MSLPFKEGDRVMLSTSRYVGPGVVSIVYADCVAAKVPGNNIIVADPKEIEHAPVDVDKLAAKIVDDTLDRIRTTLGEKK